MDGGLDHNAYNLSGRYIPITFYLHVPSTKELQQGTNTLQKAKKCGFSILSQSSEVVSLENCIYLSHIFKHVSMNIFSERERGKGGGKP